MNSESKRTNAMKATLGCAACGVAVALLVAVGAAPVATAQPSSSAVKAAYQRCLSSNFTNYKVKYVDLDGNGVKEMLVNGGMDYDGVAVYSYSASKGKAVRLAKVMPGKAYAPPVRYSKSKHRFCLVHADTGGSDTGIYQVKGVKAKRVKRFVYENGKFTSDHQMRFKVNGKRVSESKYYSQLKKALKGYKKLSAPRYW